MSHKSPTKRRYSSKYPLATIRDDAPEHYREPIDSRDDQSVSSLMDDDLVLPHLFGRNGSDDEHRDEAIEIVNISFLHE